MADTLANSGIFELDPKIIESAKNPEWRAEQRRLRKEEDKESYLLDDDEQREKRPNIDMGYSLFGEGSQSFTVHYNRRKHRGDMISDPSINPEFRNIIDNPSVNIGGIFSPKMARGIQHSFSSIYNTNNKFLKGHNPRKDLENIKFLGWMKDNNIDLQALDDAGYKYMYSKYKKLTKPGLDIILKTMEDLIYNTFCYNISHDKTIPEKDKKALLIDRNLQKIEIINLVDHGQKILSIEQFNVLYWYFSKYGFDSDDKKFFDPEYVTIYGDLMKDRLMNFRAISGYDFLDILEYHLKLYNEDKKRLENNNSIDEHPDFKTEEVEAEKTVQIVEPDIIDADDWLNS